VVLCQPVLDGDVVRYRLLAYTLRPDATSADSMLRRIEGLVYELARRYDIREIHFDPYIFTRSADDLASEGFEMVEFPQSDIRMAIATERFREHVRRELIVHDGDRDLSEQVSNAIVRDVQRGRGQRIDKSAQKAKIDACVAAAMALDATVNAVNRGDVGPGGEVQILNV
jgi:phage terminase large subunit-like protein